MMKYYQILWATVIIAVSLAEEASAECETDGWFGPDCSYQCHCGGDVACNKTSGLCPDGCQKGFFGPACQYESIPYTTYFPELPWLEDNDDKTCNDSAHTNIIRVALVEAQRLTWIRLVGTEAALLHTIEFKYKSLESKGEVYSCPKSQRAVVNNRTLDISFELPERIFRLILNGSGINSLCSLYISGGRNVAIKQDAEQSSLHGIAIASNAVDGDNGTDYLPRPTYLTTSKTCSHTRNATNEWWRVTIRQPVKINKVRLYNRPDCCKPRLKGFTLLARDVNNSTVFKHKNKGKDAPAGLPVYTVIPQNTSDQPVKRITVKKRPTSKALTLCEVMIMGENACPSGTFGLECERQCNCVGDQEACFVSTGGCPSGCAPGYAGEDCWTPCPAGSFGPGCLDKCNRTHCSNDTCHHVTGLCLAQCDPGYKTFPQCSEECGPGTYGEGCSRNCSSRCLNSICNHETGVCKQCGPGYTGLLCDYECPEGTHGLNCSETCNEFCSGTNNSCNPVNGSCSLACDVGYYPFPYCTDVCPMTTYGQDCKKTCSERCLNRDCHHVTGNCTQCAAGYTGEFCRQECPPGRYGLECLEQCSVNCAGQLSSCDHVTGLCDFGCVAGYEPSTACKEKCNMGTYGLKCAHTCSPSCLNSKCDHVTGVCKQCGSGYAGDFCDQECPTQTYGENCSKNCSINCLERLCHHQTGVCRQGCAQGLMGDYCAIPYKESNRDSSANGTAIGIAIAAGGILVILTIVLVVLILRGKRKHKPRDSQPVLDQGLKSDDPEFTHASSGIPQVQIQPGGAGYTQQTDEDSENVYANMPSGNTVVSVDELKTFLHQHATDSFLKDQFQSIPMSNSSSQANGLTSRNNKKNRYKNIIPYDHSRVLLQVDASKKHDDYFNASFIKGYKSDQMYIASQAPNDLTLPDFVRMIWEQRVDRIVMLTNLVELSKTKCTQYWPKEGEEKTGDITMELLTTIVFAEYTIRRLRLSKSGEIARDVTQFHFTAWPDKSVPNSPWGLVDFFHRVSAAPGFGPLLVHCSAGVGRTGTFIGLCHLLQEGEATGKMDFLATLWRLRQDRMSMIQTTDQYIFLHRAALVAHVTISTTIEVNAINEKLESLESEGKDPSTGYTREFEALASACSVDPGVPGAPSGEPENEGASANDSVTVHREKNRLSNVLPKEAHRPKLKCDSKKENSYINAVFVPSLTKSRQDILTQLPLPSTVTDFWRLVTQFRVGLIVAFDMDPGNCDETIGRFLPDGDGSPLQDDLFGLEAEEEGETGLYKTVTVSVHRKKRSSSTNSNDRQNVTCLLCKEASLQPSNMVDLLKKVKNSKSSSLPRTLYMCRNGADYCGLICVQSILMDRLEVDQCLAVPLVVGAIRAIRPQVIPTVEQYKHLYDVLKIANETRDVYSYVRDVKPSPTATEAKTSGQQKTTNIDLAQGGDNDESPRDSTYLNIKTVNAELQSSNPPLDDSDMLVADTKGPNYLDSVV